MRQLVVSEQCIQHFLIIYLLSMYQTFVFTKIFYSKEGVCYGQHVNIVDVIGIFVPVANTCNLFAFYVICPYKDNKKCCNFGIRQRREGFEKIY